MQFLGAYAVRVLSIQITPSTVSMMRSEKLNIFFFFFSVYRIQLIKLPDDQRRLQLVFVVLTLNPKTFRMPEASTIADDEC